MTLILNTGGLGYIGSHTCISLIKNGFDVLVIDSLVNSSRNNYERIKYLLSEIKVPYSGKLFFEEGDLRDTTWLDYIFKKQISINNPIDSVIHFASLKSVEESVSNPLKYWDANINSTLSLLSIMDKFNCNKIVFSSSATVYKARDDKKLDENTFQEPINPYGNTKMTIEKILKDLYLSDASKWKMINLRYFNPVGAHDSGILGEEPKSNPTNLFPILEKVVLGELEELSIFGNDWPTKDGTCVRDYIHIVDLSDAHFAALKFLENNSSQYISLNIGTGNGLSVLEIIENYSKLNNISIPYKFVERRKGDAASLVADNSLALKLLEWRPVKTIEDICLDSFRYTTKKLLI